jgi:hypothetical protein
MHDFRIKAENARVRTTRQTKANNLIKDTFYWPDMTVSWECCSSATYRFLSVEGHRLLCLCYAHCCSAETSAGTWTLRACRTRTSAT